MELKCINCGKELSSADIKMTTTKSEDGYVLAKTFTCSCGAKIWVIANTCPATERIDFSFK